MARGGSGKKRQVGNHHNKTAHIQDPDGWTHVVKGPTAVRIDCSTLAPLLDDPDSPKTSRHPTTTGQRAWNPKVLAGHMLSSPSFTSFEELQEHHVKQKEKIMGRQVLQDVRSLLVSSIQQNPQCRGRIRNAICIGLGSLSAQRTDTSMRQLILFEMVLDILHSYEFFDTTTPVSSIASTSYESALSSGPSPFPVPVYFQEIKFTDLDVEWLQARGYSVYKVKSVQELWVDEPSVTQSDEEAISHPDSKPTSKAKTKFRSSSSSATRRRRIVGPILSQMNAGTFFFAPHLEFPTILDVTQSTIPCLYLGNDIPAWQKRINDPINGPDLDYSDHKETIGRLHGGSKWYRLPDQEEVPRLQWMNDMALGYALEPKVGEGADREAETQAEEGGVEAKSDPKAESEMDEVNRKEVMTGGEKLSYRKDGNDIEQGEQDTNDQKETGD